MEKYMKKQFNYSLFLIKTLRLDSLFCGVKNDKK